MDNTFLKAVDFTLHWEGGASDDPDDPGGPTRFGISQRQYPDLDIAALTREEAVAIYHRDFWQKYAYGRISSEHIACRLFDLAVNVGPFRAHCMLQIALNRSGVRVNIDGIIGPRTLWAVNHHPVPGYVSAELRLAAIRYYVSLERDRYERGWIRRVLANPGGSP